VSFHFGWRRGEIYDSSCPDATTGDVKRGHKQNNLIAGLSGECGQKWLSYANPLLIWIISAPDSMCRKSDVRFQ